MDEMFRTLLDETSKFRSGERKIITIVADNFSLIADQAIFLKAILDIPEIEELPHGLIRILQFGPLPTEVEERALQNPEILTSRFDQFSVKICDQIEKSLQIESGETLFFTDVSRLELSSRDPEEAKKLLALVCKMRNNDECSSIILYQNSAPNHQSKLLRDLIYISDGVSRVQACKAGYLTSVWYKRYCTKGDTQITSVFPKKVETRYHVCKIKKYGGIRDSAGTRDLFLFKNIKEVSKNYDLENDTYLDVPQDYSVDELKVSPRSSRLDDYAERYKIGKIFEDDIDYEDPNYPFSRDDSDDEDSTKPYTAAKDPQKSRIFYYPDKEDDIDEDDPDNDLLI